MVMKFSFAGRSPSRFHCLSSAAGRNGIFQYFQSIRSSIIG